MTTATRAKNIGVYLRISADPDGTQTATKRQLEDCKRFAGRKGWHVADVFEDIDTSAFARKSKRPEFERMLESLKDQTIDGVLCWKIDRLSRRQRDLVRVDEQCEETGGFIATVVEGIDTSEPSSRFIAELLVSQARMESENTSIRLKRAHQSLAKTGQPVLGGYRAFGYERGRSKVKQKEAGFIREAALRIIAGEGVRGVSRDWAARGIVSTTGKPWQTGPLRRMLMNPTISGQRHYQGVLTPGTWPAIITPAETATLQAILTDPSRRTNKGSVRSYLLSGGLGRCGRCDAHLVGRRNRHGGRRYVCDKQPWRPDSCGRLARLAEPVEEYVAEAVFAVLEGQDVAGLLKRPDPEADASMWESVAKDEAALEQLAVDFYRDSLIERSEFLAARDSLKSRLEQNQALLAKKSGNGILTTVIGKGALNIRKQWQEGALDWKQAIIAAVLDYVVIEPSDPGRNTFDSSKVRFFWRV